MSRTKTKRTGLEKEITILPGFDPYREAKGYRFEAELAQESIDFIESYCTHVKGKKAREPYILEPHERAIVANLFGWVNEDGMRRFRECLFYVPRKQSKSTLCAAIALRMLFMDDEAGAELYSAATDRDQAALVFGIARDMLQASPELSSRCRVYSAFKSIEYQTVPKRVYRAISAVATSKHGYNPSFCVIDELHGFRNGELVDVLQTGTGARRQPLIIHATTADYLREGSVCNEKYDYACKVRDGHISDPGFLPVIYEAKLTDDWTDPKVWAKANPNLGKSVSLEYLARECSRAKESPAYENTFKRLHLNIRTESQDRLLDMDRWNKLCGGALRLEDYAGKTPAGAALDLGQVSDFTVLCVLYDLLGWDGDPPAYAAFWWHWTPEMTAEKRQRKAVGANYTMWANQGWMKLTEGDTTDYSKIVADIIEMAPRLNLTRLAVDRLFQGAQPCTDLQNEGFEILEFGQGFVSMAAPTVEFINLIQRGAFKHGNNPCIQWQAGNLMGEQDAAGNVKPSKAKSANKIDGMVSAIMSVGIAMKRDNAESWLENNEVIYIE